MPTYRLGLDMGANSIGWCAVRLDAAGNPSGVLDAGVRILTPNEEAGRDPQSKSSLAAARRLARGQRRRRSRFVRRRDRLMEVLVRAGLMPEDEKARKALEALDPYWLRREALDRRLEPGEIGRALFHLNQRRGFKSNRIADSENDEKSAMKKGVKALEGRLASEGARTLGELLALQHGRDRFGRRGKGEKARPVRFRPEAKGSKNLYELYPTREMLEREIDAIWEKQKEFHPDLLTDGLLKRIRRIVVEQRPLKEPVVGNCSFFSEEKRAPKAHPLFQRFRILQDVCQLRVTRPGRAERPLSVNEHKLIAGMLRDQSALVAFEKMRKKIKLPDDARFNYERAGRKGFQSDETARVLAAKKAFGPAWRKLPLKRQIEIVERLIDEQDEAGLCRWLRDECGLDEAAAEYVNGARLPQGHGSFGVTALRRLVEVMERESREVHDPDTGEIIYRRPLTYNEAMEELGLHHSNRRPGEEERQARLPYYGEALPSHVISQPRAPEGSQERIGRVPNPTVHIGLNQLRKVINALIDEYGPPQKIAIELARELKLNKERKDRINRENRENEKKNEGRREELAKHGFADTHDNRLRLRLFDELPPDTRLCVYSGKPIGKAMLFSAEIEIDHVLPHSQTLDDSFPNKVLCTREMNRRKRNNAPEDAWSGVELEEICERAERLFPKKAWRFAPGAMKKFEEDGGFLARQMTDTQHMSRMAKTYLEHVCGTVQASPGRLTAMLRARWGLNGLLPDHNRAAGPKNRTDHRHHAIDAFVIACTDLGLLNRIARASGQAEELDLDRLYPKDEFPIPFEGYREALGARLDSMVISHKPDHGLPPSARVGARVTSGQLLDGTAYGLANGQIDEKRFNLVRRKPIHELTAPMVDRICNSKLQEQVQRVKQNVIAQVNQEAERAGLSDSDRQRLFDKQFRVALEKFGKDESIRRIRVFETRQSFYVVEHNGFKKAYETADNHCIEIYKTPNGDWHGAGVTVFDANQSKFESEWLQTQPDAELVMRLHKGDMIEANFDGGRKIYRVYVLEPSAKRVRIALHYEAGSLDTRHRDKDDPFERNLATYDKLKAAGARRVRVDSIGRVRPVAKEP